MKPVLRHKQRRDHDRHVTARLGWRKQIQSVLFHDWQRCSHQSGRQPDEYF